MEVSDLNEIGSDLALGMEVLIHSEEKGELRNTSESLGRTHRSRKAGHATGEFRDGHEPDPIYPKYIFRIY